MIVALRRLTDRTLDLDTLDVLARVAETGSLSAAAGALGVTQQAVSARIRVAERMVGHLLVHRSTTGSVLTETGRLVVGLAGPVLDASRHLEAGVAALRTPTGSLVVAASQTIAELLLPGWLLEFRRREPDVRVRLIAGNSAAVTDLVQSGGANLGFTETPVTAAGVSAQVIADDELAVVVAPEHPWARSTGITAEVLAATALLLREEGSGTRATLAAWLREAGLSMSVPAAVLETTSIIRANAQAGIAPAVMSLRTVAADINDGSLVRVPLAGPPLARPLRAIWSGEPQPAGSAFLRVAHEVTGRGQRSP
ncbi:putative HTH-type transcriptional regulator [Microbacterium sp. MM2322]|jgi:molybdate transport repressor ModE-like protein|uniref:LysR family transcriptional regulator n=3 Tax=Curtobacterium TaxID=2034 RepID=A0ABN1ZFF1_9MICO|nr:MULTISPECIES: LysR family transcriptional regulator [Microbacteriaceae]MCK9914713.1 LysR family transcriptional regulator [Microbacteriaceae bacterium K1510]RKT36839.1 molybdate transport repressor ModE-like protein [Microbacterium sp. AG1240]ROP66800.1 molybdate transport repressor ModE-like protein [Curtobacterium sp. PhB115]ROS71830.1 molybdate transport repressor ModE-like protein [Curtobacterium sp. PhB130]TCK63818.1 molybdate transport repressor ModE-like protein [Curtobacterium sp. P